MANPVHDATTPTTDLATDVAALTSTAAIATARTAAGTTLRVGKAAARGRRCHHRKVADRPPEVREGCLDVLTDATRSFVDVAGRQYRTTEKMLDALARRGVEFLT